MHGIVTRLIMREAFVVDIGIYRIRKFHRLIQSVPACSPILTAGLKSSSVGTETVSNASSIATATFAALTTGSVAASTSIPEARTPKQKYIQITCIQVLDPFIYIQHEHVAVTL